MSSFKWAEDTAGRARDAVFAGKPIGKNTRLYARSNGEYGLVYHSTEVITYLPNGDMRLAANGRHTVMTMQRLRGYSPARMGSIDGQWAVRLEPDPKDPRPEIIHRQIPKPYTAIDPGPEPVKNPEGCIADTTRDVPWDCKSPIWDFNRDQYKDAEKVIENGQEYTLTSGVDIVHYHEEQYNCNLPRLEQGHLYEQCPHCKEFDAIHRAWQEKMRGGFYGGRFDQQTGYETFAKMMEKFDGFDDPMKAWHDAYLRDFRARKAYLKLQREWESRNYVLFFDGILINSDGFAYRNQ